MLLLLNSSNSVKFPSLTKLGVQVNLNHNRTNMNIVNKVENDQLRVLIFFGVQNVAFSYFLALSKYFIARIQY